jgi:isopentenyl diphosphate isomerase/L-lactate dehydrogenase-like FMN-dependent dehydrogenase
MPRTRAVTELARMLVAGGISTDPLEKAPTVADVRALAKRRIPKMSFDFVDGGAGAEITLRANIDDLAQVVLRPRSLVDVSEQDLTTTVTGQDLPIPLVLSPCGLIRVVGGDGELAAVRAAGRAGLTYTISTASSWSIEEIATEATGPLWFQLYMWRSREVISTLVRRAQEAGCLALVVTVDVVVNAKRPRDHRNGMSIPPQVTLRNAAGVLRHPAWFASLLRGPPIGFRNLQGIAEGSSAMSHQDYVNTQLANVSATWDDIAWLRREWPGPLFIKGITTVEDALDAARVGADGVFVSNHGGRQLDGVSSSIRALPAIADAVGDRLDIVLDSGIRSGGDVVKAVALGAKAAAIGRSWVWGAAAAGDRGVDHVLHLYRTEIRETLTLLGCPAVTDLDRSFVDFPSGWTNGTTAMSAETRLLGT